MPINTTIRPRHPSDLPSCASLLARVYEKDRYPVQGVSHAVEFLSSPSTLRAWVAVESDDSDAKSKNSSTTQQHHQGEEELPVLGHAALTSPPLTSTDPAVRLWRSKHPSEPIGVLERLFVDPMARGRGLAEALMRAVSAEAAERGLRAALFALVKDQGAMRLYERVGWREFGRAGYAYEDGEGGGEGDGGGLLCGAFVFFFVIVIF